jgi:hypothetical protein
MRPLLVRAFFIVALLAAACVEPISINNQITDDKLVIDGYFTTDTNLNTVRLSKSAAFSNNYPFVPFNAPVVNAVVSVIAEDGTVTAFHETEPGLYVTNEVAVVGKQYYLLVELAGGTIYKSDPEKAPQPVPIDSMSYTVSQETVIENQGGTILELKSYFFNVHVSVADPNSENNFYLWRARGTFEYITLPPGDAPCQYCYCYAPLYPLTSVVNVRSDEHVNGGEIYRKVASIKYDRNTAFLTTVDQFSISPKAYGFWKRVADQQASVGSIFDPAPAAIRGNVYKESDMEEVVLGYFTVASIGRKHLLIDRGKVAKALGLVDSNLIPPGTGDCRLLYNNATHIKPVEFYD